jgi:hypothetical protein
MGFEKMQAASRREMMPRDDGLKGQCIRFQAKTHPDADYLPLLTTVFYVLIIRWFIADRCIKAK